MKMPFAICRVSKIKSLSALKAHSGHATREKPTPNANDNLTPYNPVLIGSGNPEEDAQVRLSVLPKPPRKNGVLAIEVLLTASPTYFRPHCPDTPGEYQPEKVEAFNEKAVKWAQDYFGEENVVSCICHLDEATPHLSVTVIPLDTSLRKKGHSIRLNAARWLDGRKKLSAMQDSFHDAVKSLELERGIRGSKASHQQVKKYYTKINNLPLLEAENDNFQRLFIEALEGQENAFEEGQRYQQKQINKEVIALKNSLHKYRRLAQHWKLQAQKFCDFLIKNEQSEHLRNISSKDKKKLVQQTYNKQKTRKEI